MKLDVLVFWCVCVLLCVVFWYGVLGLLFASPLDESPCEAGAPCAKCLCMGDYGARLDDDEPNSENSKYPRHVCKNFCVRACCKCTAPV